MNAFNQKVLCIVLLFCCFLIGFTGTTLYGQDPNKYEEIIEPGLPGTINTFIAGDTLPNGVHPPSKYILRRDGIYIYTDSIKNPRWHIIIEAEAGAGARPILRPQARPGGAAADRALQIRGDFTVRGLHIIAYDNTFPPPGIPNNGGQMNSRETNGCRIVVDDCIFEQSSQEISRFRSENHKMFFTNSTFKHIYAANEANLGNFFRHDDRFEQDTLSFSNCTFLNSSIFHLANNLQTNYLKIEHCTFVNLSGIPRYIEPDTLRPELLTEKMNWGVINLGQVYQCVFRNNLLVNVGFAGAYNKPKLVPQFIVNIDSTMDKQDPTGTTLAPPEGVDIRNNNIWLDPALSEVYPEFIKTYDTNTFYDPTAQLFINAGNRVNTLTNLPVSFVDGPRTPKEFVTNWYKQLKGEFQPPLYMPRDSRIMTGPDMEGTLNFAYTDAALLNGSTQGQPVGDLRWHNVEMLPTEDEFTAMTKVDNLSGSMPEAFILNQNYPNPFNSTTTITFDIMNRTNVRLVLYNSLGQITQVLVDKNLNPNSYKIQLNADDLPAGIYFYKLQTDTHSSIRKMVLIK